jgi:hypothetical protein
MIGCAEIQLGSLYLEHFLPKIAGENGISMKNNRRRNSMNLEDMIHENLTHNGGGKWVCKRTNMSILGMTINEHHDD